MDLEARRLLSLKERWSAAAQLAGGRGNFNDRVGQLAHGADEKLHNGPVKLRIRAALQLGYGVRGGPSPLVAAVGRNGIAGVRNRGGAGPQWESVARRGLTLARA